MGTMEGEYISISLDSCMKVLKIKRKQKIKTKSSWFFSDLVDLNNKY